MGKLREKLVLGLIFIQCAIAMSKTETRPNIVTVMIDDMGWNDVGWHDESFFTPTMNSLAMKGIVLERFYTSPTCTPARSQFMTGRYNIRNGMQDSVIHSTEPRGVPLNERFLSAKLSEIGYETVAIGKWHLGMHQDAYLPLQRGFSSHYGIYTGGGSHTGHFSVSQSFTVRQEEEALVWQGYNLWENGVVSQDNFGTTHSTHLYSGKAVEYVELMDEANDDKPFFLYLAYQAIHDPIQVGDEKYIVETSCNTIKGPKENDTSGIDWDNRKILCGMVGEIDDGVKNLFLKLKELDEWDNTLMLVFSDNGGVTVHGSKNLPLRGEKADYWEGGVRTPAFVTGGYMESQLAMNGVEPYHSADFVHVTDLHRTILEAAAYSPVKVDEEKELDGVSHLDAWAKGGSGAGVKAPRSELLININSPYFGGSGALISGDYKLATNPEPSESKIYAKTRKALAAKDSSVTKEQWLNMLVKVHADVLGDNKFYLFNIVKNPFELEEDSCTDDVEHCSNLYGNPDFADIQAELEAKWAKYQLEAAPSTFKWADDGPLANPENFGGMWASWRDGSNSPKAQYLGMDLDDTEEEDLSSKLLAYLNSKADGISWSIMSAGLISMAGGMVALFTAYRLGKAHATYRHL